MSWSLSMSGHYDGPDAEERENALIENVRTLAESSGASYVSLYTQHHGTVNLQRNDNGHTVEDTEGTTNVEPDSGENIDAGTDSGTVQGLSAPVADESGPGVEGVANGPVGTEDGNTE